jgi:hypothetical protein
MEDHHSIHNVSFFDKPRLSFIDKFVHDFLQPKHKGFGEDFVNDIEQTYRSVLLDFVRILDFRKLGNYPVVYSTNVQYSMNIECMSSLMKPQQC